MFTGPISEPINEPINEPIKLSDREQKLLFNLRKEPEMTRQELSNTLSCSESTVKRELKKLLDMGVIIRIGSKKKGAWIIRSEKLTDF